MPFLLSQFIEICRWVGALVVLGVHATNGFVNLADIMSAPHAASVYVWWFFAVFSLGHQAVVGFFVMSGWLVGGAVLAHLRKEKPFLRDYLIHRFSRIYLVVAPAVVFTLVIDSAGRTLFASTGVYDWPMLKDHSTSLLFFTTLANLQGILFDPFGSNGPLWSLACEFWYYITFPLLLLPFARNYSKAIRFGGFALGFAIVAVLAAPASWFRIGYVIWALSAFATLLPRAPIRSRWGALAIYAAFVILVRFFVRGSYLEASPWLADAADFVGAALFLLVLLAFLHGPKSGFDFLRPKLHKTLADFSFSLYCLHLPIIIFMRALVEQIAGHEWASRLAGGAHYAIAVGVMALSIVSGYVFSRFTEAKTGAARRALRAYLDKFAPAEKPQVREAAE